MQGSTQFRIAQLVKWAGRFCFKPGGAGISLPAGAVHNEQAGIPFAFLADFHRREPVARLHLLTVPVVQKYEGYLK